MSAQYENDAESVFVARQPIFDRKQNIWGYELLFRSSGESLTALFDDAGIATAKVIADGFLMAAGGIKPGQRTLVNFPRSLLVDLAAFALPSDIAVIEMLESVTPDAEVLDAIRTFKDAGYTLALDDFIGQPGMDSVLKLMDIVKVDILALQQNGNGLEKLREVLAYLKQFNCQLLAEKVEDIATYNVCKKLGFSLFQGFFFAKPEIIPGKKISSGETAKLHLLRELGNPEFEVGRLSKIIQTDLSLSYRLLRYINSAGMGVHHNVESIQRAITLLGQRQLAQWLRVVIMADMNPTKKGEEMAFMSVQRARFLELLETVSEQLKIPQETLFLLGLFSLLDALLGQSMEVILAEVPISAEVKDALSGKDNPLSALLHLIRAYEHAQWDDVTEILAKYDLNPDSADQHYTDAMTWTQQILGLSRADESSTQ